MSRCDIPQRKTKIRNASARGFALQQQIPVLFVVSTVVCQLFQRFVDLNVFGINQLPGVTIHKTSFSELRQ